MEMWNVCEKCGRVLGSIRYDPEPDLQHLTIYSDSDYNR